VTSAALTAGRILLGALFVWASATKVPDMAAFAESVANYRLLPPALVPGVAAAVVGVELVAGLALVFNVWARAAALTLGLLLAAFTAGVASVVARGIDVACGCFGGTAPATWWTVLRDVALLALAATVALRSPRSTSPGTARPGAEPAR
jgi:putative oxidoreductase